MSLIKFISGLGIVGIIIAVIIFIIICLLIVPFVLMLCWNLIMPKLFGFPTIGLLEALALVIVVSILFGGISVWSKK